LIKRSNFSFTDIAREFEGASIAPLIYFKRKKQTINKEKQCLK